MTEGPKSFALLLIAGVIGFSASACVDRSLDAGGACFPEGEWDHDTWCQYGAQQIEKRHGLSGYAIAVRLPIPEGGCGACDEELVEEGLQQRIDEKCPDGIIEFEAGCSSILSAYDGSDDSSDDLECGYMGFAWGESCSNLNTWAPPGENHAPT